MKKKLTIGLIFGGKSGEHEVSLVSARSIFAALDKKKYDVKLIGIDKVGKWHLGNPKNFWLNGDDTKKIRLNLESTSVMIVNRSIQAIDSGKKLSEVDVFFPITHGTFGEDGCLQGFLELLDTAYVGSGVLSSAVGMDKDVMKRLFREAGIPIGKFRILTKRNTFKDILSAIRYLKFPIFVKPANLGSSIGISKAKNRKEFKEAIETAFQYDNKVVLEEAIIGREIECSVLGNIYPPASEPIASLPGEIKLNSEFYSYEAKYLNNEDAVPIVNVAISKNTIKKIQTLAIKVFKTLDCEGMGRVDFFLKKNGEVLVNEINTLPGFTSISMYPKMFATSGISYPELLDRLIGLALERKKRNARLKRSF